MQKTVSSNPMEKTNRPTSICCAKNPSCNSDKDDKGGGLCLEDHISGLPDVVLVSILSLLTMKEAGRTCLLSKRWRYIWTHISSLNFDASHIIDGILLGKKEVEVEKPLYLSWVNQVLKSHNASTIDEFRVQFDFDETYRFDIDNWVNFAMVKRVKRLELDLTQRTDYTREEEDYNFPDPNGITNHLHSLSLSFSSCDRLTNLLLTHVNVTGQVLEYFLINCPFLEKLYVKQSDVLVNLKVPHLSLKLKHLEIIYCFNVESIEISATNLMSFKYIGPKISLPFKNAQPPVDLYIGGAYCDYLIYKFLDISSYLSQLESLTLQISNMMEHTFEEPDLEDTKFPVLNKLKRLELIVGATDDESLTVFVPLIEACPFLATFVFQLQWCKPFRKRKHERFTSRPHEYLKVVEFIGFVGRTNDVELAMYLIRSAVNLQKITFDPRIPLLVGTPWEFMETKRKTAARKRAKKLGTKLPVGAALVIL
ncbi:putative F-box protein At3g29830 isoform X1 [Cornus florida]|uniref:putative F-box protein At3g29830 isoform X1 n=1 Tax=Cornus florida TaxID=4283 RepID=UPI00289EF5F5|nr:putative F-box protein At3g29830 isoform X1 [Cornus florida]XP_059656669.1 putative F-box protein At3g29830 isoform X1 [Cornus florida]XP_059656670.1 putative F-box protein At3g29830 isoform X1 [Cornus florida]XP_059656671.1 putative F-box protein At3g29830 isoform X1 [Cornus florida]XP_059656672.1 putative F-box protein At3g29830 isoform X1 [Cornus florida]